MKIPFKYYLHDGYTGSERAEYILRQTDLDMSRDELLQLIGRPFYEVELLCELDTTTGQVTVLQTNL
jgi:hypothetical protein